jgi:hypothetical protein
MPHGIYGSTHHRIHHAGKDRTMNFSGKTRQASMGTAMVRPAGLRMHLRLRPQNDELHRVRSQAAPFEAYYAPAIPASRRLKANVVQAASNNLPFSILKNE